MSAYRAPDLIGPVLGYRSWTAVPSGSFPLARRVYLKSTGKGATVWPVGKTLVGQCVRGYGHAVPAGKCTCGIYAFHRMPVMTREDSVYGLIEAGGDIEVYTLGFRAEHARIVALVAGPLAKRAARGRVPVLARDDLPAFLEERGLAAVPRRLRPSPADRAEAARAASVTAEFTANFAQASSQLSEAINQMAAAQRRLRDSGGG